VFEGVRLFRSLEYKLTDSFTLFNVFHCAAFQLNQTLTPISMGKIFAPLVSNMLCRHNKSKSVRISAFMTHSLT
jgi:hypothetical protein